MNERLSINQRLAIIEERIGMIEMFQGEAERLRIIRPTREEINARMTEAGGWPKSALTRWGVPWPPPKGWRERLERQADALYGDCDEGDGA